MDYAKLGEKVGLSKTKAERLVKTAMAQIKAEVVEIGHCWVGRDTYFKRVDKPERPFRNPLTGEHGIAPAKTLITMRKQVA